MLMLMGNIMPKMQPNGLAGIRLPWLRDPMVWRKTQRLGGILLIVGGLVLLGARRRFSPSPSSCWRRSRSRS